MKISETCSCGASVEAENDWPSFVYNAVREWRTSHRHEATHAPEQAPEQRGTSRTINEERP